MANSPAPTSTSWTIHQGATFTRDVTVPGSGSIAGWAARCKIRLDYDGAVIATPLAVVSNGAARIVTIELDAVTTAALEEGGVSDVEVESPIGVVVRAVRTIPALVWPEATY